MSIRFEHLTDADWHYLDEERWAAVEAGARDAYQEVRDPIYESEEDFVQNALIYAALHKKELERIRTTRLLRRQIRSRLIESGKRSWNRRKNETPFGDLEEVFGE